MIEMFTFFTRSPCRTGTPGVFFASELPVGAIDEKPEKLDVEKKVTRHPLFALGGKLPARSEGLGAVLARPPRALLGGLDRDREVQVRELLDFLRAEKPETPLVFWPLVRVLQSCRLHGMASREAPATVWSCPPRKPR